MKVLVLSSGISVHTERFLGWLTQFENQVWLSDYSPLKKPILGVNFIPYPSVPGWIGKVNRLARFYRILKLKKIALVLQPDIIHEHYVDSRAIDCMEARLHPLVLSCWGTDINAWFDSNKSPRARQRIGAALRSAQHVFGDAPYILERAAQLAEKALPSSLLYFGISIEKFRSVSESARASIRSSLKIPQDAIVFFSIRLWNYNYNHQLIIQAFAQALPRLPKPAYLLLKPSYPLESIEFTEMIKQMVNDLNIGQQIVWLPYIDYAQIPDYYAASDVILNYPSRDGMPVSFFEAAAAGKALVSSNLPAYQGVGLDAFFDFVPSDNVDSLANQLIATSLRSPLEKKERHESAVKWAVSNADEKLSIAHVNKVYQSLSGKA